MSKTLKNIILCAISFLSTILFWYMLKEVFSNFSWLIFAGFVTSISLCFAFWMITLWLVKNHLTYTCLILAFACFFLFFPINIYYIAAILLLLVCFSYAGHQVRKEEKARIKIDIDDISYNGLKTILFALWILISLIFYYSPYSSLSIITQKTSKYTEEKIISYYLPGFTMDMSVDDFILLLQARQQGINKPIEVTSYINEKKLTISDAEMAKTRNNLLDKFKINHADVSGTESIADTQILQKIITDNVEPFVQRMGPLGNIILTIIFYLLLSWILGKIFTIFILLFIWIIYKLLLNTNFMKINKTKVDSETIIIH